jgi:hypothetical protein
MKDILSLLLIIIVMAIMIVATIVGINRTQTEREVMSNPINDALLTKIARVESSNNPRAVSSQGAIGLYQIRYSVWHKELKREGIIKGKQCLFNPSVNRLAALHILNKYHAQTGNLEKTLVKYSGNARNYYEKVINND